MNLGPSPKVMDSMTNVSGNTKITMYGKCSLISSIISHSLALSKVKSSVLMAVCRPHSPLSMIFVNSIDFRKFHMRVQFVIFCGVILMKGSVSMSVPEEQDGLSAR